MKKLLLCLATALFLVGCAQDFDLAEPPAPEPQQAAATTGTLTRSLDGAVYNEVIGGWMIPQADPFALENVQAAYDKLAEGRSAQTLSKSEAAEFKVGKKLAPTHYALKIYPKSEEEQWRVEMMDDVKVAYIPFSYSQLTQDEAERVEQSGKTRSAANTFTEKSPYTVTYDRTEVTDGGPTGPVTYQLPILYAVWPADKPFPIDLEYGMDYPVFLPDFSELASDAETRADASNTAKNILFGEAVAISRNETITQNRAAMTRATNNMMATINGGVVTYDDTPGVKRDVPLANLKVRTQSGSFIIDTISDSDGQFTAGISLWFLGYSLYFYDSITFTFTYQDPLGEWKITAGNSTAPHTYTCSSPKTAVQQITTQMLPFITNVPVYFSLIDEDHLRVNEIHRAVNYFYNVQDMYPKYSIWGGTVVRAHNVNGRPFFADNDRSIYIYNRGTESSLIGDVFHELGHLIHYKNNTNSFSYDGNEFLYESFASYVGWYLGEAYYQSIGWTKPSASSDITRYGQQEWNSNYGVDDGRYSPLFIDLTDNYNQSSVYSVRPNDVITNIPPYTIWLLITTNKTWTQCRARLQNYVGTYYTSAEFNQWIQHFDLWESRNHQN